MNVRGQSDAEIVDALGQNDSRQYTEAAHAEMMRRQIAAYKKAGNRIFWLTVIIALLGLSNVIVGILNFMR